MKKNTEWGGKNMLLSNVEVEQSLKSTFWHHYSDWSEWNDKVFFMLLFIKVYRVR